jgi:nicotinamidase-related amidase
MIQIDAKTVLLPIDNQCGFDGAPWPPRRDQQSENRGRALIAGWRAAGLPLIHVRHDSVTPRSVLAAGHAGNRLRPGFEPMDGEPLVTKSVNASFIGTDLDLRLRRLEATTVVCFGVATDMCVSTTARVGANLGYRMIVVGDACDCFDLPDAEGGIIPAETVHRVHLATLAYEFCDVADTAAVLAALEARSTT